MKSFSVFKTSPLFHTKAYELGRVEEGKILPVLRARFVDPTIDFLPEGATFDFHGDIGYIEFKRRYCSSWDHSDVVIGVPKIVGAHQLHARGFDVYFVFQYDDGVFQWKFNPYETLRQGKIKEIRHYFIPRHCLSKFPDV